MACPYFLISFVLLASVSLVQAATSISSTILVIATSNDSAQSNANVLRGYGIPYETLSINSNTVIPALNSSATNGNYGGFVVVGEILSSAQQKTIYTYQENFRVRLVKLDAAPSSNYGVKYAVASSGCCDNTEQLIWFSNTTGFPTAGIRQGATMTTLNLWHSPAVITNTSIAWEAARYGTSGSFSSETTAAVINKIGNRQQMVFFIPFENDWSTTSVFLTHAYVHYLTRGVYAGYRRVYLGTQVDDMHLSTDLYGTRGAFRLRAGDLATHKTWLPTLNSKLNPGSTYWPEIGHNGNGNIVTGNTTKACSPGSIEYIRPIPDTPLEYEKPLGTGDNCWPNTPTTYGWSSDCYKLDALNQWFANTDNLNTFAHLSHTFTHEALNNATFFDVDREIRFNQAWLTATGIASATKFSPKGLIPPAITGLHNGDAIRAWTQNGITTAVGDNTRPVLLNTQNEHWPLLTNKDDNGYDGFPIIPRWASNIYYDCDKTDCIVEQYNTINPSTTRDLTWLLNNERDVNTMHLLALRHDPYMFHQANMRQTDVPSTTINGKSQQLSLLQMWVELVTTEFTRLVQWPIISLTHDQVGAAFLSRLARDACRPSLAYNYNDAATKVISVTLSASSASCPEQLPVTVPGQIKSQTAATTRVEQIGLDPRTIWVTYPGTPVTLTLSNEIDV